MNLNDNNKSEDILDEKIKPISTEGLYYIENGFMVFTEKFHLRRGYCCGNGCRHCPYRNRETL